MILNVHAGHSSAKGGSPGAVGLIQESVENRIVKDKVIALLRRKGHTVYDCTVESGTASGILSNIVKKCNAHSVDLDVSIHFNAYNKTAHGVEVLVYSKTGAQYPYAENICKKIAALGFTNRGVKVRTDLYFLSKTKAPALLVECCFVDSPADVRLYQADAMAKAIAEGILTASPVSGTDQTSNAAPAAAGKPANMSGASLAKYAPVFNAAYYANKYADLKAAFGTDAAALFNHFLTYGIAEGRQASATFHITVYKEKNADLQKAFGNDLLKYIEHYLTYGQKENRICY